MEGAYEGALGVPRRIAPAELEQPRADPRAQLAGGPLGEGDRENPPRRDVVLDHRPDEALDEHRGLAAARRRRQRQRLAAARRRRLLLVGQAVRRRSHRSQRQIEG
jgi:hypothetical protein